MSLWWCGLGALRGDAVLYGASALFAMLLGLTSGQPAQMHWGYLAAGPYALAAVVAFVLSSRPLARTSLVRVVLLGLVMVGTVAIPLGLEARWRQIDHAVGFAQPEVAVIERSGFDLSKGIDPYRTYYHDGRVVDAIKGIPSFESFFPYFPLMGVFGLPSAVTHKDKGLTDARIIMSLLTLLASGVALGLLRASREKKLRVAQVLIALPSGALFLATGGDDMPILALLLLGVVALQRRQNNLAGISIGLAAAMKLTAWPMALGALVVARDDQGRRAWLRVAAWCVAIVVVTVTPFAIRAPWAFVSNVFEFPLGLGRVTSPAASALPGHILTTIWPPIGHLLAPVTFLVGGSYLAKYVKRTWPLDLTRLLGVLAVCFAVMMCVASATRIGYVIYPLNFALWSWATKDALVREPVRV